MEQWNTERKKGSLFPHMAYGGGMFGRMTRKASDWHSEVFKLNRHSGGLYQLIYILSDLCFDLALFGCPAVFSVIQDTSQHRSIRFTLNGPEHIVISEPIAG